MDIYVADGRASLSGVLNLLWLLVRWLLVVAACWAGFYAACIPGLFAYGALRDWCPWGGPEFVAALQRGESVSCPMPAWIDGGVRALFSSLAAVAVVWLGTVTAPTRRVWLPWAVYLSGATVPVYWTLRLGSPLSGNSFSTFVVPAICSLVVGALTAKTLARRMRRVAGPPDAHILR